MIFLMYSKLILYHDLLLVILHILIFIMCFLLMVDHLHFLQLRLGSGFGQGRSHRPPRLLAAAAGAAAAGPAAAAARAHPACLEDVLA